MPKSCGSNHAHQTVTHAEPLQWAPHKRLSAGTQFAHLDLTGSKKPPGREDALWAKLEGLTGKFPRVRVVMSRKGHRTYTYKQYVQPTPPGGPPTYKTVSNTYNYNRIRMQAAVTLDDLATDKHEPSPIRLNGSGYFSREELDRFTQAINEAREVLRQILKP